MRHPTTAHLSAVVRPRVFHPARAQSEVLLFEDVIAEWLAHGERGFVHLVGPPGSGKSFALAYLSRVFEEAPELVLIDAVHALQRPRPRECLVVFTEAPHIQPQHILRLAPWGLDEVIEYLIAAYPLRCGELLRRFELGSVELDPGGLPALITTVIEEMAFDPRVDDVTSALRKRFESDVIDEALRARVRSKCLPQRGETTWVHWVDAHLVPRIDLMRNVLAADAIVDKIEVGEGASVLECAAEEDLRRPLVAALKKNRRASERLFAIADHTSALASSIAIELLNAVDPGAVKRWLESIAERRIALPHLSQLRLPHVDLTGVAGHQMNLVLADLSFANITQADLSGAEMRSTNFDSADMSRSVLSGSKAANARFVGAKLVGVNALAAVWPTANLRGADLRQASFSRAKLMQATFDGADLSGADFRGADVSHAVFEGAELIDVDFREVRATGVQFSRARLASRRFASAELGGASFEGVVLDSMDFRAACAKGALFTGSHLQRANFRSARLDHAGLADVHWEGADLTDCHLEHASFHLGSSRSGLVFHASPMEGSRTGFYSEDSLRSAYVAPEDLRKANLRNVDLRGAHIFQTDFYLVDVRGARYDAAQGQHLKRCGAILDDWVGPGR